MMVSTAATTAVAVQSATLASGPVMILNKKHDGKKHDHDKDKNDDRGHRDKHRDGHGEK
jgi:hypothetical protein